MTEKDKELLLKDLCTRLLYGVKVLYLRDFNHEWYNIELVDIEDNGVYVTTYESYANGYVKIEEVKPYLFPMSSMTEEDIYQINDILGEDFEVDEQGITDLIRNRRTSLSYLELDALFSYLNKNHFDYRGLIEKGLAIDATNLNIY